MKQFSPHWISSKQPRKQRKYRAQAPLHLRQKFVHVHLSLELRKKYGQRNVQVREGDLVRVMSGEHAKKEGKVLQVNLRRSIVFVQGVELVKKEGSKVLQPLSPSRLLLLSPGKEEQQRFKNKEIPGKMPGKEKSKEKK